MLGKPTSHTMFPLAQSKGRLAGWFKRQTDLGMKPIEYLIPKLEVETPKTLPDLLAGVADKPESPALRREIDALEPWGYAIKIGRDAYIGDPAWFEGTTFRLHLMDQVLRQLLGKKLAGATVLDMATNHGTFALQAALRGAAVEGIDLRDVNIRKALLLQKHLNVPGASFRVLNAYDARGSYDVAMNIGLLYHVTDPFGMLRRTYELTRQFAIVDTLAHRFPVAALIQATNKDAGHHAEGEFSVEYHPTYRGLIDLMHAVGFRNLVEAVPVQRKDRARHPFYEAGNRRCIIGFK